MFRFKCIECKETLQAADPAAAMKMICPQCGNRAWPQDGHIHSSQTSAPPKSSNRFRKFAILGGAAIAGCILVAVGLSVFKPSRADSSPSTKRPLAVDEWTDAAAGSEFTVGNMQVRIDRIAVDFVQLLSAGFNTPFPSSGKHLQIAITIRNLDPVKQVTYEPWQGLPSSHSFAQAQDELASFYKRAQFGSGTYPVGQVQQTILMDPGREISDLILFDPPIADAKEIRLTLPGENIGQTQAIKARFHLNH
jgi:hypothetical protein